MKATKTLMPWLLAGAFFMALQSEGQVKDSIAERTTVQPSPPFPGDTLNSIATIDKAGDDQKPTRNQNIFIALGIGVITLTVLLLYNVRSR